LIAIPAYDICQDFLVHENLASTTTVSRLADRQTLGALASGHFQLRGLGSSDAEVEVQGTRGY
jgi:hypothetical protein